MDYIAPTMKELGFKKKARWFHRQSETGNRESMNIYSSMFSDRNHVKFTLELYARQEDIGKDSTRVGFLKTGRDTWYELTPKVNADQLGEEIRQDILTYVPAYFESVANQTN